MVKNTHQFSLQRNNNTERHKVPIYEYSWSPKAIPDLNFIKQIDHGVLIPGIDSLIPIWHNFLEFLVLNALQLHTCLALLNILILASLMSRM